MMIEGVDAKELVQRSIDRGLVQRPVPLQSTLAPEEQQDLRNHILAARARLRERQRRQADARKIQAIPPNTIVIDGRPASEIAEQSIKMGLARKRSRRKIRSFTEIMELRQKQRQWVRESTRRWREKKKAEKALAQQPPQNIEQN